MGVLGSGLIVPGGGGGSSAHDLAGANHNTDTLADLNSKISDGNLLAGVQGSFTPAIADSDLDGSGEGQTYTLQIGRYLRIGDWCIFQLTLQISGFGTLTAGEAAAVVGLPFAASDVASFEQSVSMGFAAGLNISAGHKVEGLIQSDTQYILLTVWDDSGGSTVMSLTELSSDAYIRMGGAYLIKTS